MDFELTFDLHINSKVETWYKTLSVIRISFFCIVIKMIHGFFLYSPLNLLIVMSTLDFKIIVLW